MPVINTVCVSGSRLQRYTDMYKNILYIRNDTQMGGYCTIINCSSLLILLTRASIKLLSTVAYSLCVSNNCFIKLSVNVETRPCVNSINVSDDTFHDTISSSMPPDDTESIKCTFNGLFQVNGGLPITRERAENITLHSLVPRYHLRRIKVQVTPKDV